MEVQSEQQNNPSEEHGPQAQASVEHASVNVGTASNNVEATSTAEVQVSTVPGKKLFFFLVIFIEGTWILLYCRSYSRSSAR